MITKIHKELALNILNSNIPCWICVTPDRLTKDSITSVENDINEKTSENKNENTISWKLLNRVNY